MEGNGLKDWRKSTYSSSGGDNCVEVASSAGAVLVRDTADRDGGTLSVEPGAWASFLARL